MELSVCVPVYNGAETIETCLNALIKQKGVGLKSEYEIIIVDDGSTDQTLHLAQRYPVRIIKFPENKGRIIARREAAKSAKSDRLLFVDVRVIAVEYLIRNVLDMDYSPVIIGDLKERETKYKSVYHTFFYLVRRRAYSTRYFPQKAEKVWIGKKNFKRVPKGTTVLFIKRDLFLRILPPVIDKNVNDDTTLFHKLVFEENTLLLRSKKIKAEYLQRHDLCALIPWLFDRGTRFADFYFRPSGYLFIPFVLSIGAGLALIAGALASVLLAPVVLFYAAIGLLVLYTGLVVWLSENPRDFLTVFFVLPFVALVFGAGVIKFLWLQLPFVKQS